MQGRARSIEGKYKIQEKNIRYKGKRGIKTQNTKRKEKDQVILLRMFIGIIRRGVLYIKILFCKQIFE
jgi:hypothetical protein